MGSHQHLSNYPCEVHHVAARWLRDIGEGFAHPHHKDIALCGNLNLEFEKAGFRVTGYYYAQDVFVGMGLAPEDPIPGHSWAAPECWEGEDGVARRDLARRMAEFLETHFLTEADHDN